MEWIACYAHRLKYYSGTFLVMGMSINYPTQYLEQSQQIADNSCFNN